METVSEKHQVLDKYFKAGIINMVKELKEIMFKELKENMILMTHQVNTISKEELFLRHHFEIQELKSTRTEMKISL